MDRALAVFVLAVLASMPAVRASNDVPHYGACVVDDNADGAFAVNATDFCVGAKTPRECIALKGQGRLVVSAPGLTCVEAWALVVPPLAVAVCLPLDGRVGGCDDAVPFTTCHARGGMFVLNADCRRLQEDQEDWRLPTCEADDVCEQFDAGAGSACPSYCSRATFQCSRAKAGPPFWAWLVFGGAVVAALVVVGVVFGATRRDKKTKGKKA